MINTKQKVLSHLFRKLDTIKLEIHNSIKHAGTQRYLQEFEKDKEFTKYDQKIFVKKTNAEKTNFIGETHKYLEEIRVLPLYKILRNTSKIVTYEESIYKYEEKELSDINFYKKIKISEADQIEIEKTGENEIKRKKLVNEKQNNFEYQKDNCEKLNSELEKEILYKKTESQGDIFTFDCFIVNSRSWDKLIEKKNIKNEYLIYENYYREVNIKKLYLLNNEFYFRYRNLKRNMPDNVTMPFKNSTTSTLFLNIHKPDTTNIENKIVISESEKYKKHLEIFRRSKIKMSSITRLSKTNTSSEESSKKGPDLINLKSMIEVCDELIEEALSNMQIEISDKIVKNKKLQSIYPSTAFVSSDNIYTVPLTDIPFCEEKFDIKEVFFDDSKQFG